MNKNVTPIILLILAIGIYFTFTDGKINEIKEKRAVNADYDKAFKNAENLIKQREEVRKMISDIDAGDLENLNVMLPDNIDNVRLTLDVKNIGLARGLVLRNVKTNAPSLGGLTKTTDTSKQNSNTSKTTAVTKQVSSSEKYDVVTLSFSVSTTYDKFMELLGDLEKSLRILDVSKITVNANDTGVYDYGVELNTYWLKDQK